MNMSNTSLTSVQNTPSPITASVNHPPVTDKDMHKQDSDTTSYSHIANTTQKSTDTTRYPGRPQNRRYHKNFYGSRSRSPSPSKLNPTKCESCGMNNYDVDKNINKLHTCDAKTCCYRGPEFVPHQPTREHILQLNAKNGCQHPPYLIQYKIIMTKI